jgi:uncharacterized protein YxeA
MKKLFIIITSIIILAVGVYYLTSNNNTNTDNQAMGISIPKNGVTGGQTKNSSAQPMPRRIPSGSTKTS